MKIAVIIVRILMGLVFVASAIVVLFNLVTVPPLTGNMKTFNEGIAASGYLITLIKVTELICGIALITGRFVALAAVILFPIIINIVFVHALLDPSGLPVAIFLLLGDLFIAYYYRKNYQSLFAVK